MLYKLKFKRAKKIENNVCKKLYWPCYVEKDH